MFGVGYFFACLCCGWTETVMWCLFSATRCLGQVEETLSRERDIVAMIVEPIQAEGGDRHASPAFFRQLRALAKKYNALFICDEVQTGGGHTGTMWAHEHWNLQDPPDIVSFAKRMQTAGYFLRPGLRPPQPYRIFNTWLGDPVKMISLRAMLEEMERDHLLENVRVTGKYMLDGLHEIAERHPHVIQSVRGIGTFQAFDLPMPAVQMDLIKRMRNKGVLLGVGLPNHTNKEQQQSPSLTISHAFSPQQHPLQQVCGHASVRIRPSMVFRPKHADIFLNILDDVVGEMAKEM